jgi:hypothetical protein
MHVFLCCLVREVLLQRLQQGVEPLMLRLGDANLGEHRLIRQISFRELPWIKQGHLVTLVHQ